MIDVGRDRVAERRKILLPLRLLEAEHRIKGAAAFFQFDVRKTAGHRGELRERGDAFEHLLALRLPYGQSHGIPPSCASATIRVTPIAHESDGRTGGSARR